VLDPDEGDEFTATSSAPKYDIGIVALLSELVSFNVNIL
jgi:hypothetical protein